MADVKIADTDRDSNSTEVWERIVYADLSPKQLTSLILEAPRRENMQIEEIYFFGSRARGENTWDSDYDLLIILSGEYSIAERKDFKFKIHLRFSDAHAPVDLFLIHVTEVPHYRQVFGMGEHIREALEKGFLIYPTYE